MKRKPSLAQVLKDHCRKMLAEQELRSWKRCLIQFGDDDSLNTVHIMSGNFRVATFNLDTLKRDLSAENFHAFRAVFEQLQVQAQVASYAVHLAEVEMGAVQRLADQLPNAVAHRKSTAEIARSKAMDGVGTLQREADRLRKKHPERLTKDIRTDLAKFLGANKRKVRAVKIGRPRKKVATILRVSLEALQKGPILALLLCIPSAPCGTIESSSLAHGSINGNRKATQARQTRESGTLSRRVPARWSGRVSGSVAVRHRQAACSRRNS